ncbi:hypothetical protein B9Z55_007628 [Caenorhabditis nigoni]|uniref:Uncharacterized protein n=1 Tax=Caenorhabditis nigoni TaxID=1611254 RepID=A0A2G5VAH6_9PELO|nr:hypothetical protein B9Z55_007628 [Caenorhabditis nigoni]
MNDRVELIERRSHSWPKFQPTKESFRSFVQRVNEHANATMRTEADALRAFPTMLSRRILKHTEPRSSRPTLG